MTHEEVKAMVEEMGYPCAYDHTRHELFYEKSEAWIETEKMYEVLYELIV